MPYQFRRPTQYLIGQLSAAATISDTTISSTVFASLPTVYTTTVYLPLVLHDPALGVHEVVWVTGHAAASNNVTIERGKEGTPARAWPSATQVLCAPTIRDGASLLARATLPTDPYVGERHPLSDEGIVLQSTYDSGWQPDVGIAVPAEYGLTQAGGTPSASRPIVMRGGQPTIVTDASGHLQVTYTAPMPHATLHAVVSWVSGGGTAPFYHLGIQPGTFTSAGFKAYLFRSDTGVSAGTGVSVTLSYLATGN